VRLVAAAALALGAFGQPGQGHGHAIVMASAPGHREQVEAPRQLVLRFNSRIEKRLSSVTLIGPDRRSAALAPQDAGTPPDTLSYPLPELAPGTYRARWKVLAVDGHITEGVLQFTVVRP
jgi:methionine-rich copper-binding protein CopC